jgi:prohibitin 1
MEFVLLKEEQEAKRKKIEAQGIADFQRIITQGLTDNLLRWKGIEATIKLAESPNTKVVVIGSSKTGLPLILGGEK